MGSSDFGDELRQINVVISVKDIESVKNVKTLFFFFVGNPYF